MNANSSTVASAEAVPATGELSAARTDTRSLAVNARSGTNALPRPSGNPINRPVCDPLRDPLTVTALSSEGASAGKPICDPGEASGVPGGGAGVRPRVVESGGAVELPPEPKAAIRPRRRRPRSPQHRGPRWPNAPAGLSVSSRAGVWEDRERRHVHGGLTRAGFGVKHRLLLWLVTGVLGGLAWTAAQPGRLGGEVASPSILIRGRRRPSQRQASTSLPCRAAS